MAGSPDLDSLGTIDSGAVDISYGSFFGLDTINTQFVSQDSFGVAGIAQTGDRFASSLASGDFNGDGYDDLAVGAAGEDWGIVQDAGSVNLLYGSVVGITAVGNQRLTQNDLLGGSVNEAFDGFGSTLAVGDFNLDGYDDLVVGSPTETWGTAVSAGAVDVIYGSALGLTGARHQFWTQDTIGVQDIAESYDRFGSSLAVQDFNGDGIDDLAIGASGEDIGGLADVGAVHVLHGSLLGLVA